MSDDPLFAQRLAQAGAGDVEAQYAVAQAYLFGTGVEESVDQALSWLRRAAEDGHRAAQVQLADHFRFAGEGEGGGDEAATAAMWYRRAADQNDAHAQFQLGRMYLGGIGVAQDELMAANLFRAAGAAGNDEALRALATMGDSGQLTEVSAAWMEEAAGKGDADAQFNRGNACWDGTGTTRDRAEAVRWYEQAAAQGHGPARHRLAQLLWAGEEVGRDRARAVTLFRQAAGQGVGEAQATLAHLYLCGVQVGSDTAEALRWLGKRLWTSDEAGAQHLLGEMFVAANSVPSNPAEGAAWLRRAAEHGVGGAQARLGNLYLTGRGVPLDPLLAVHWLKLAAAQGYVHASLDLGRLYLTGGAGVPADPVAADRCFEAVLSGYHEDRAGLRLDVATAWLDAGLAPRVADAEALLRRALAADDAPRPRPRQAAPAFDRLLAFPPARSAGLMNRGLAAACYRLAQCYRSGHGVDLDLVQAVKWLDLARCLDTECAEEVEAQLHDIDTYLLGGSAQGIADLAVGVAEAYAQDRDVPASLRRQQEIAWWRRAAERGDVPAQLRLWHHLPPGEESIGWLRRAAEAGDESAQCLLGQAYEEGRGVAASFSEALHWYCRGADRGDSEAQYRLANLLVAGEPTEGDRAAALALYRTAADHGHDGAQVALATLYLDGHHDVVGAGEAAQWLRKSEQGWRECVGTRFRPMLALAMACMTGDGVERDPAWATEVLHEATVRYEYDDDAEALGAALYTLGQRFRDGIGVEASAVQAIKWFDAAARLGMGQTDRGRHQVERLLNAAGDGKAALQRQVGEAFLGEVGCPRFQALAEFWLKAAAAEAGGAPDWMAFGECLLDQAEPEQGALWIRRAAEAGHAPAQEMLATLLHRGLGGRLDPVEAARWQARAEQAKTRVLADAGDVEVRPTW